MEMKLLKSRTWAVLAVIFLFAATGFADGSSTAKDKDGKTAKKAAATSSANTDSSSAKGTTSTTAAKPAPKPKLSMHGTTADETPKFSPVPAFGGGLGFFTVQTGEMLPKGGVSFSAGVNKFSRAPGSITVLNDGFNIGFGLTDWLSAYIEFDPERHVHVGMPENLSLNTPTTGGFNQFGNSIYRSVLPIQGSRPAYVEDFPFASNNGGGVGDVTLGLQVGLLSEARGNKVSFNIDNKFFIPTKSSLQDLLNSEGQSGQFDYQIGVNLSKHFLDNNLVATVGGSYRFTRDAVFNGTSTILGGGPTTAVVGRADQARLDIGFLFLPDHRFQPMAEFTGLIFTGSHTPDMTFGPRDPVDGVYGFRLYATHWLALDAGYRYMLNLSQVKDRNGFVLKLASVYWPEKPKAPDNVTVSCSVDKSSVVADSNDMIQAMARGTDTYSHPLNFTWTATGGKVDGTGPDVRWDGTGVAAGTYTIMARADDGRGNNASCSTDVTVQPKPVIPPPAMTCAVDHSTVQPGERTQVTATVEDKSNTPLAYTWQTNGGQIVGEGATVQLDTTGLAPGNYTITGRVENGIHGAADCTAGVTVQAPPAPPQAAKVGECSFKHASARVDNVCKRVLDDLAVRLQNDAKAKAVLVGYSDPKEKSADKLASERAENARKYLSKEKNVAEDRVDVRTATGQEGADKQNLRVDVIYVPEGATY
jgi:outer membrane protein OmpA-like peptidoglycan-associated protein